MTDDWYEDDFLPDEECEDCGIIDHDNAFWGGTGELLCPECMARRTWEEESE